MKCLILHTGGQLKFNWQYLCKEKKSIFRVTLHRCKNCMSGWPIQVLEINPVHLTSFQALSSSRAVLAGGFQLSLDLLLVNQALALKLQISGDKITVQTNTIDHSFIFSNCNTRPNTMFNKSLICNYKNSNKVIILLAKYYSEKLMNVPGHRYHIDYVQTAP